MALVRAPLIAPQPVIGKHTVQLSNLQAWYRPTFAPEQGSLLVLFGAIIIGASFAQAWTSATTWVCVCTFFALQVEHPLVVLLRVKPWKLRYVIWGGLYGAISLAIAIWLSCSTPVLLWLFGGAVAALIVDLWAATHRQHKAIANEITMFAAICLATPLTYGATTGTLDAQALGLWILNTLFFATAVFTIKFRKGRARISDGVIYGAVAVCMLTGLVGVGALKLLTALTSAIAILKFGTVVWLQDWYRTCWFGAVARFETYFALTYICFASLTLLPPHLKS